MCVCVCICVFFSYSIHSVSPEWLNALVLLFNTFNSRTLLLFALTICFNVIESESWRYNMSHGMIDVVSQYPRLIFPNQLAILQKTRQYNSCDIYLYF